MKESAPASAGHTLSSRIAKEPNTSKRRRLIHAASGTNTTKFVKHLYDEVIRLYHVDLAQAERLADAARLISGYMKNELAQALACRSEGHVPLARGQYENALQRYSEALAIYRRRGDELEVGRTLYSGSLQALIYLSRYEQAFAWAEEARAIFEARGDRLRLARLDSNMGNVLFRQDRYAAALKLYRQAYRELLRQGRHQDVAVALHNIATCCISLNDFNEALRTYQRARNYCSEAAMPLLAAQAEYNIAYLHYLHGQYATALRLYEHTRSRCFEIGDPYHAALSDLDQSEICLELNLTDEASRLAERASESFSTLNLKYEEAKALTNLAISASRLGRVDQASELFEKARTARIMPLKAFRADGVANEFDVIRAIYFAADNGAKVINMSFSITEASSELMRALNFATGRGVLSIASAGNTAKETLVYPAGFKNVVGVASTNYADQRSSFSNFGPAVSDLAAPGEALITTFPGKNFAAAWGTSFATPLVSGTTSLLVQFKPGLQQSDAEESLSKAVPISNDLGLGRLDVYSAVQFSVRR